MWPTRTLGKCERRGTKISPAEPEPSGSGWDSWGGGLGGRWWWSSSASRYPRLRSLSAILLMADSGRVWDLKAQVARRGLESLGFEERRVLGMVEKEECIDE